jgi:hypothetical protein
LVLLFLHLSDELLRYLMALIAFPEHSSSKSQRDYDNEIH